MNLKSAVIRICAPLLDAAPRPQSKAAADSRVITGTNSVVNARISHFGAGTLIVGDNTVVEGFVIFNRDGAEVRIGSNTHVDIAVVISAVQSVVIEDDVSISFKCTIMDSDGHSLRLSERRGDLQQHRHDKPNYDRSVTRPIRIRRGARLGPHCMVLKGVTVGVGATVTAASVVTQDVPDWTVVAGNPARPIQTIDGGGR